MIASIEAPAPSPMTTAFMHFPPAVSRRRSLSARRAAGRSYIALRPGRLFQSRVDVLVARQASAGVAACSGSLPFNLRLRHRVADDHRQLAAQPVGHLLLVANNLAAHVDDVLLIH